MQFQQSSPTVAKYFRHSRSRGMFPFSLAAFSQMGKALLISSMQATSWSWGQSAFSWKEKARATSTNSTRILICRFLIISKHRRISTLKPYATYHSSFTLTPLWSKNIKPSESYFWHLIETILESFLRSKLQNGSFIQARLIEFHIVHDGASNKIIRLLILFIQLITIMGCVGGGNKKPEDRKGDNPRPIDDTREPERDQRDGGVPEPENNRQESNRPVVKLSQEQVRRKREEMRANLEEGHSKPPQFTAPTLQPISNIEQ